MKFSTARDSCVMFPVNALKDLNHMFRRSKALSFNTRDSGGSETNNPGAVTSNSPVSKRRVFSGKWLPPPLRKLSQGKLNASDGAAKPVPALKKTSSDKKLKLPPTSPTAASTSSDMGNRPSAPSEEEEEKQPRRSYSGDVGSVEHNGDDPEEEVEVPPPMKPISKHLLEATATAIGEESQAKREQHSERDNTDKLTMSDLALDCRSGDASTGMRDIPTCSSSVGPRNMEPLALNLVTSEFDSVMTSNGSLLTGDSSAAALPSSIEDEVTTAVKKRMFVIQELIKTEQDYVRDLKDVIDGYMAIMRDPNSDIQMPEDIRGGRDKIILGNIEAIYEWHRDIFSKALDKCLDHPEELGPLFKKYERKLHMYVVYCQNKPMSEFIVSEHIDTYFEEIRQRLGHKLTLCDLLIKPVQRIMKYQLLLKDILKYTERIGNHDEIEALKQACNVMHVVPKEANDMMNVGRLQGFDGKITAQGKLLLFGPLLCGEGTSALNFKGKELQVFFFEQSIILSEAVGKKTQFSNPVYIYKAHIQ
ncbi:unnamed protein product, partial [Allacma fusca]